MHEIWKPFKGFEEFAEVSNFGRVRTKDTVRVSTRSGKPNYQKIKGKVVSPYLNHRGYPTIAFKIGSKRPKTFVHRAVAHAFVDGYFDGASVNHMNGIKTDNRPENLEWCTVSENTKHQWKTGLIDIRGERHPSAKLKNTDVLEIRKMLENGDKASTISKIYNVSVALIYKIQKGTKKVFITLIP